MPARPATAARQRPRVVVALGIAVAALAGACGDDHRGRTETRHPLDDVLRVNHIQMEGTHNSYHLRPSNPLFAAIAPRVGWAYDMPTLTEQLDLDGVRQVELDVHWQAAEQRFAVYHVPIADPRATCGVLQDCLAEIWAWSAAHPGHHPLLVMFEPKDDVDLLSPIGERVVRLDDEVRAVWPEDRLVRPDDVRGAMPSLRAAVLERGWPTLAETRGKTLFVLLDEAEARARYLAGAPDLADRVLFVIADPAEPVAAFTGGDGAEATALVRQGFMLRELSATADGDPAAQPAEVAEDFALGFHAVSTDFPSARLTPDLAVSVPGGTPSRCNPVSAPPACTAAAIEDPVRLGG